MKQLRYRDQIYLGDFGGPDRLPPSHQHKCCPYCKSPLFKEKYSISFGHADNNQCARYCLTCGWWEFFNDRWTTYPPDEFHYYNAVLRSFDIDNLRLPVRELATHLVRRPEARFSLSPRRFEELLEGIFREHFQCDVTLTTQSKDGGIDLYCVDQEHGSFVVEAKRYSRPVGVAIVRELLGAMVASDQVRGVLVTTSVFTAGATRLAKGIRDRAASFELELVDGERLLEHLSLYAGSTEAILGWEDLLEPAGLRRTASPELKGSAANPADRAAG